MEDLEHKSTSILASPRRGTVARRIFPFCLAEIDGDRLAALEYNSEEVFWPRNAPGYSNFRELTRGALTVSRRGSDINIALPKRNTLSRGKFPPEDQGSKLLKSFLGVPNSVDFSIVRRV